MFTLDFKPQFLNYPLDAHQCARVSLRTKEIHAEASRLHAEIIALQNQPEYSSIDKDSHDRYAHYIKRLQDRVSILQEQQRQYQQVVSLNSTLERQEKMRKHSRPEVAIGLLEQYKQVIAARKSRKIEEKMREVEIERCLMEEREGRKEEIGGSGEAEQALASQLFRNRKVELNPEKKAVFGKMPNPAVNLLRFRDTHSQQPSKKLKETRKSTMEKEVKLPSINKQHLSSNPPLLVQSSPMKFNSYRTQNPQSHISHIPYS